ncbi:phage portal protein [Chryseomicrobium palamuruense]
MTIEYLKQKFPPKPFDEDYEHMHFFRDLYEGNHKDIFPRAQEIGKQTVRSQYKLKRYNYRYMSSLKKKLENQSSETHYVMVNLASSVVELPADLINRSIGNISGDTETEEELLAFVGSITTTSKAKSKLWPAIVQHQVDGGVAYRVRMSQSNTVYFEWKEADIYFEHGDGFGADFAWTEEVGDETYLRVERQRLEEDGLVLSQLVFAMNGEQVEKELDFTLFAEQHGIELEAITLLPGVTELMCGYVPNDETLMRPRGRSALRNIAEIQEEINWTITRDSIVFEKHGKPKLAIPKRLWDSVANHNHSNYGSHFVRNADLEVVSYDENNGAVPMYITWDAQTEQSFKHVSRLIEYMMSVSKTAATAIGLGKVGGTLSAKAILYEWIQSVIKAEAIRSKFDIAMKDAYRKCMVLSNALNGTTFTVQTPVIEWKDMLPKADSENDEQEAAKYEKGVQSLESTIRNLHPDWSENAIQDEIKKIQDEQMVDSLNPTFTQPPRSSIGSE